MNHPPPASPPPARHVPPTRTSASTQTSARRQALAGIGLTVAACASFSLLDAASKQVGAVLPMLMALFLRYVVQSLFTTGLVLYRQGPGGFRTAHPRFQVLRGLLFCATNFFAFASILHMPLAEFTAIVAATPLCVTLVAALALRQPVSPARWALVVLGMAGTLLIIRPGSAMWSPALLWPLAMLCTGTAFQILSSKMAGSDRPETTQFYTGALALVLAALALPWSWQAVPEPWVWGGVLVMGLASGVGHLLLLTAYTRTTPAVIAPFLYSQIAFAMLVGWVLYRHLPDGLSMLGIAAIAFSGAASTWLTVRETR